MGRAKAKEDKSTEIILTHVFKSNDMVAESDLLLRFEIRELLSRTAGVDANDQYLILRDEARRLKKDTLGFEDGSGPALAIVRADAQGVLFIKGESGGGRFCMPDERSWGTPNEKAADVVLPFGTFPDWPPDPKQTWRPKDQVISTNVPFVPAHITMPGKPENYYILFEVDKWARRQRVKDPYLLQRLNDNTFVVLAEWDVSPVEAIVMRGE